jgi:predicted nucleic acid-binding protein
MVAPDAINPEVLSTLRRFERIGELRAGRAMQAVDDLLETDVRRFPTLPLLPESWALRASRTPYDACHVAWPGTSGARWSPATAGSPGRRGWACRWSPCSPVAS